MRAVDGRGHAYRMGGDEFCVLAAAPAEQHAELGALTRAAHGDGFAITAALGTATIDTPNSVWDDALRDADRRMYAEKNGLRASAGGQSAEVLLRVLAERHPAIGDHVDTVAALTEMVGVELDMTEHDLTTLWQAAALHDIGKAAVPDAILDKPGPLDDDEWEFMRRHTIIGERILDGAPALSAAARLVGSSHERFDGKGYPDQLADANIPLGARIVAVCDAYDAMVSDRPYRRALPSDEAIQELTRCAGTQFDPAVVEAFAIALAARSARRCAARSAPRHSAAPCGSHPYLPRTRRDSTRPAPCSVAHSRSPRSPRSGAATKYDVLNVREMGRRTARLTRSYRFRVEGAFRRECSLRLQAGATTPERQTLARDEQRESEPPVGARPLTAAVAAVRTRPSGALAAGPWRACRP